MKWRLRIFFERLIDYIQNLHVRLLRFFNWLILRPPLQGRNKFLRWISCLVLLVIDITPLPLLYECLGDVIKQKSRPLNDKEKELAIEVFHNSIPLHLISVDPASLIATSKSITGYVSFQTINYDDRITSHAFIHEMMHVWQYRKRGAAYMSESIWAQWWGGGYNYGGIEALKKTRRTGL